MEHRSFTASLECNWASQIGFVQKYLSSLKSIQLPEVIFICSKMQTNTETKRAEMSNLQFGGLTTFCSNVQN